MSDSLKPPSVVAAYYDRLAPVYGEGELFGARRAAVLEAIALEVSSARRVLDLGCGNGAFSMELTARAPAATVVGADLSPEMLHVAQRRCAGRVPVARADAAVLPFRSAAFDLVFMSHVLMLIADLDGCLAEIVRCLTPTGRLAATVGAGHWRSALHEVLTETEVSELETLFGARGATRWDDGPRVATACEAAGLRVEWRTAPFSATWSAMEDWVRIRWLTIFDESMRARAESWLAQVRPRAASATLHLSETVLVACRP